MKVLFFPRQRLHWDEGFLIGFESCTTEVAYQVFVSSIKPNTELINSTLERVQKRRSESNLARWKFGVLGVWLNEAFDENCLEGLRRRIKSITDVMSSCDLNLVGFASSPPVSFLITKSSSCKDEVIVVFYGDLPRGSFIGSDMSSSGSFSAVQRTDLRSFAAESLLRLKMRINGVAATDKSHILNDFLPLTNLVKDTGSYVPELKPGSFHSGISALFKTALEFPLIVTCKLILNGCHGICNLINWLQGCLIIKHAIMQFLIHLPMTNQQLIFRLRQLDDLYHYVCEDHSLETESGLLNCRIGSKDEYTCNLDCAERTSPNRKDVKRETVYQGNIVFALLFDVVLGLLFIYWVDISMHGKTVTDFIVESTEVLASLLSKLLNWMVGAPAGLKLNKELAHFLGKFFHYHIYLWRSYLALIQPYLHIIVLNGILSGCLGVTFLVALASDMLSLVTIHIYCFYVYAARLYSLEIYGLISLARLFTGKKWNPLRKRLDSIPFDVDHLFLGTVLFTILLFLLPTVALFYVVFTALRLTVLLVKEIFATCVYVLNYTPLYSMFLCAVYPEFLPAFMEVRQILTSDERKMNQRNDIYKQLSPVLFIEVYCKPCGIIHVLRQAFVDLKSSTNKTGEEQFVMKILKGHLVYPWNRIKS